MAMTISGNVTLHPVGMIRNVAIIMTVHRV